MNPLQTGKAGGAVWGLLAVQKRERNRAKSENQRREKRDAPVDLYTISSESLFGDLVLTYLPILQDMLTLP